MKPNVVRPLVGAVMVLLVAAAVAFALTSFSGGFNDTVPVTVMAPRAGLVMNPDAKVKMRGVLVGRVETIEERPNGQAALRLAMNTDQLKLIPADAVVDIASSTVFGAKFVQLLPPDKPSGQHMQPGQVLTAEHVTVEINTVFEQLTSLLAQVDPAKLNETLGAISRGLSGRGPELGQALSDIDAFLAKVEPSLPALRHDISTAPRVFDSYNNVSGDLIDTARNAVRISQTIVDEQHNLDALLVGVIGLADVGQPFLADNRARLTDALHLLLPTAQLFDQYNPALTCGLKGMADMGANIPVPTNGLGLSASFMWGHERYRYPGDLPKVAAKGGPRCEVLPVQFEQYPPFVVTDIGAVPFRYGNQNLLLNSDGLKQLLYGPIDGPPRNTAQIGQPG